MEYPQETEVANLMTWPSHMRTPGIEPVSVDRGEREHCIHIILISGHKCTNRSFLLLEKRRWTTLMRSVRNAVSTNQRINKLIKIILPPTLTFTLSGCWSWLNWAIKANTSIGGDISTLENNEAIFTVDRSSVFLSRSSSGQCCQGALLTSVS